MSGPQPGFESIDYLEGLMEGFVAYDAHWRMTYMNAAAERLLGRSRAEVLGKTWHQAFPHAVGNPVDHMYQRVMGTRRGERMEYYYSHYRRWMEISASPVRTGGVGVYFRDISDRKEAERAMRQATEELRDADRRKDQFLAVLGHELRNPLAPIRNAIHLLRHAPDADTAAHALAVMERQSAHLVRMVDDLLEVSRVSRGKIRLQLEDFDVAAALAAAVETCRPAIEAARHALRLDLPGAPLPVRADFVRIAQVVSNLLNNAAKYTEGPGRIVLAARREGAQAVISVKDSGIGIAPEVLPRLFEIFSQADASQLLSQGGLGIGLALSRSLVELHGGTIEARSDGAGRGAEFVVRLPALAGRAA